MNKKFYILSAIALALIVRSLWAGESFQRVTLHSDMNGDSHFKASHQGVVMINDENFLFLCGGFQQFIKTHHQVETGIGYRKFLDDDLGVGINLFYSAKNHPDFFIHQVNPGIECIHKGVCLTYNRSFPLKRKTLYGSKKLRHQVVSEFGVNYRFKDLDFGISPIFNHVSRTWDIFSKATITVVDSLELSVSPFYKENTYGAAVSIGIKLGGSRAVQTQEIRRVNNFYYKTRKKSKKSQPSGAFIASPEMWTVNPVTGRSEPFGTKTSEPQNGPGGNSSLWDRLFSGKDR